MHPTRRSPRRKIFAAVMFGLALGIPTLIAHILDLDQSSTGILQIIFCFVVPAAPFAFLGIRSLRAPSAPFCALNGAAVGALLAVGVPYGLAWYRITHYAGGGADIGLGLLLLAMPIYLTLATIAGWFLGGSLSHHH